MIGSGLKKLAKENGMKINHGVAYGNLRGYCATLSEGAGYKKICFATTFANYENKGQLQSLIEQTDVGGLYRVQGISFTMHSIQVVFLDNPGTIKKIMEFLDWFIPQLQANEATVWNVCPECGTQVINGRWILLDDCARYMHESCAQKMGREMEEQEQTRHQATGGSYLTGAVGAFLGAALGAVAWAILLMVGFVASIVGLLIGWLSNQGYQLMKGKTGKGKIVILIFSVVFGVVVGTFGGYALVLLQTILEGPSIYEVADIPNLMIWMMDDPAVVEELVLNVLMGLGFAALGVYGMLKKASVEVTGKKIIDLE